MFGDKSSLDLQALLQEFIQAIAMVVQQQIEQEKMTEINQEAQALQSAFSLYRFGHPPDLLFNVFWYAHNLTFQAGRFSYRAVSTFAIAGGLELAALHERERLNPKLKGALAVRAKDLVKTSDAFRPALAAWNKSKFPGGASGPIWSGTLYVASRTLITG